MKGSDTHTFTFSARHKRQQTDKTHTRSCGSSAQEHGDQREAAFNSYSFCRRRAICYEVDETQDREKRETKNGGHDVLHIFPSSSSLVVEVFNESSIIERRLSRVIEVRILSPKHACNQSLLRSVSGIV